MLHGQQLRGYRQLLLMQLFFRQLNEAGQNSVADMEVAADTEEEEVPRISAVAAGTDNAAAGAGAAVEAVVVAAVGTAAAGNAAEAAAGVHTAAPHIEGL